MRRRYVHYYELTVHLAEPSQADEKSVRELGERIAAYITQELNTFPWGVDITMSSAVDRVEQ